MFKSHRILVLCQNYPSQENPFSQPFIHSRMLDYLSHFDVRVLNFSAKSDYDYEGVKVITEKSFDDFTEKFDLVMSHAPNIRNHERFIVNNISAFNRFIFTFHGYEVINILKRVYSQKTLFPFAEKLNFAKKAYHLIKLPITFNFLKYLSKNNNVEFIFVSHSLLDEAKEDLKAENFFTSQNTHVIHNPINTSFYTSSYQSTGEFDFICLRPFDDPKYGVDLFIEVARNNPTKSFHLYGKGTLLVKDLPANLMIKREFIKPDNLPETLNRYKAAILPTRWDSQGVLACEVAEFGMPLFTSDLQVCREFLGGHENVQLVSNDSWSSVDLEKVKSSLPSSKNFDSLKTTKNEIDLICRMLKRND